MKRKFSRQTILTISAIISAIIALCFIIMAMIFSYQQTKQAITRDITLSAKHYRDNLTTIFKDINQGIKQLSEFDNIGECSTQTISELQKIVFNHPLISALGITNNNGKVLCTNTGKPATEEHIPLTKSDSSTSFTGPLEIPLFNNKAFYYTQNFNKHNITALILPKVIRQHLGTPPKDNHSILLFNVKTNKIYLSLGDKLKLTFDYDIDHFPSSKNITLIIPSNNNRDYLVHATPINPVDNLYLMSAIPLASVWQKLRINNIIIGGVSLLIAIFIVSLIQYSTRRHLSLDKELKRAIKRNEFIAHYQPVINLQNGLCLGVELLVRWQASPDEIIMPDYFIATAERTGIIEPLTDRLIDTALKDCQQYLLADPEFHLSINLSTIHFQSDKLFHRVLKLCQELSIQPNQILFELTERHLIDTANHVVKEVMTTLHQLGFKLAIDDFGTGYSSLTYLKHFNFDYLKIDRLFVSAIGTGAITENLNESIISMANSMNYQVIAEGIETESQHQYLKQRGVTLGQGWLFSKPLSIDKLDEFITQQNTQNTAGEQK